MSRLRQIAARDWRNLVGSTGVSSARSRQWEASLVLRPAGQPVMTRGGTQPKT